MPSKQFKPLIEYIDLVATEISYFFLLAISVFSLLIVDATDYAISIETKYLLYVLILAGFVFLGLSWYKRKELEKKLT